MASMIDHDPDRGRMELLFLQAVIEMYKTGTEGEAAAAWCNAAAGYKRRRQDSENLDVLNVQLPDLPGLSSWDTVMRGMVDRTWEEIGRAPITIPELMEDGQDG